MRRPRLAWFAQATFCLLVGLVASAGSRLPSGPPAPAGRAAAATSDLCAPSPAPAGAFAGAPPEAAARASAGDEIAAAWEIDYQVVPGDALLRIAARFHVPLGRLMMVNGLRNPHHIRAGRRLRIPLDIGPIDEMELASLPPALRRSPERLQLIRYFDRWAETYDLDPDLLKALGWVESNWRYDVVSSRGAIGIGQLMPQTVRFVSDRLLGRDLDPWTPDENIHLAARFLRYLLDETDDVRHALAAYYQGLGALRARGPYADTGPYVENVLAARRYFAAS